MRRNHNSPREPLTFVVHRVYGALSPAIYAPQDGKLIGCKDPVVYSTPVSAEIAALGTGKLYERYLAARELGALPERVGPPTPRSAA